MGAWGDWGGSGQNVSGYGHEAIEEGRVGREGGGGIACASEHQKSL